MGLIIKGPPIPRVFPPCTLWFGRYWTCQWCGQYTWYCWWKKSCTTWDAEDPVNNGINYLWTGAGFLPSTVASTITTFFCQDNHTLSKSKIFGQKHQKHIVPKWWFFHGDESQFVKHHLKQTKGNYIYQVIQAVTFSSPIVGRSLFTPLKGSRELTIPKKVTAWITIPKIVVPPNHPF